MSRDLAFSTNAFKQNTLREAIRSIADAGYRAVELMADLHHAYPPAISANAARDLRREIVDLGLVVSNINAFTLFACGDTYHPTWIEDALLLRQRRLDHTLACIDLAASVDCGTVSIQPGGPTIGTGLSRADALQRFAETLAPAVEHARNCGATLAIEPEPGLLLQTSAEYVEFKRRFFPQESAIRMNGDLGHLYCVGEDPSDAVRRYADEIAHIHLEDIPSSRVHQHLTPGRGAMDFAAIFRALDEIGYAGHVTVELYPYEASADVVARQAIRHLRRVEEERVKS
jgi:sugar phosphate isomerase/epimerase